MSLKSLPLGISVFLSLLDGSLGASIGGITFVAPFCPISVLGEKITSLADAFCTYTPIYDDPGLKHVSTGSLYYLRTS